MLRNRFLALAGAFALAGRPAAADPTVIRDNRLTDLAITPTLGRGYAPGPNAMYSVCFDALPTTTASFDFDYVFEELAGDQVPRGAAGNRFRGNEVEDFLRTHTRERTVVRGGVRHQVYYLLATLVVDSYYSSIDEGKAKLSASAQTLLRSGDVLGFFTGCGTHYVRSLARRSYFLTLFSYATPNRTRDGSFERTLQLSIRRLDPDGVESASERTESARFSDEARSRDLRIVSRSIGLVSQSTADLVPFDLAGYKASLKQAFMASQNEHTGRIASVEVTPWLSNPTVLAALAPANPGATGHYQRKQILADNAEFYLTLVARIQALELLVHKARLCRRELEMRFLVGGAIRPELAQAEVMNHRTGGRLALRALVDTLSEAELTRLEDIERRFTAGGADVPGAGQCISELERGGLTARAHHEIPACMSVESPMVSAAAVIDDHCLPELAPPVAP